LKKYPGRSVKQAPAVGYAQPVGTLGLPQG
jgi:hypothetical protein